MAAAGWAPPLGWCWPCLQEIVAGTKSSATRQAADYTIDGTGVCGFHAEKRAKAERESLAYITAAFATPRPRPTVLEAFGLRRGRRAE